jgi:1,4-alpha-glucan branching enzyme
MRAPAVTPGMGSLLTEEGCCFRVWAPNAKRLEVVGDFFHYSH